MKSRPRLSIPLQLTLLAILITALAVFVAGRISEANGRTLLTEQAVQDLGDKTNLRVLEIHNALVHVAREVRILSSSAGKLARDTWPAPITIAPDRLGRALIPLVNQRLD